MINEKAVASLRDAAATSTLAKMKSEYSPVFPVKYECFIVLVCFLFFVFLNLLFIYFYIFIFGCVGSSFLCEGFL